jgi:hypothetical protein
MPWQEIPHWQLIAEQEAECAQYVPDPHGVPSNMFGPVPEEFYGLVGRVTMIWPVVESRVHWLHDALTHSTQDVAAGWSFDQLYKRCLKSLGHLPDDLQAATREALELTREVAHRRNEIVHSSFPGPRLDEARGHRPVPPKLRTSPNQPAVWITTSRDDLRQLVADGVAAMGALEKVCARVDGLRSFS